MDNIVRLIVADRAITVTEQPRPIVSGNVGVDFVQAEIDGEWDGLAKRVTFTSAGASVTVPFAETVEIPHECLTHGYLSISIVGVDADGEEVLRTKAMRQPLVVDASGADMGSGAAERTMDVAALAEKRMDELEAAIPAVESDWASVKAAQAGEFYTAQQTRSETFSQRMSGWEAHAGQAAQTAVDAAAQAVEAAQSAQAEANSIRGRAEAGEFNGAAFSIKYTAASVAGFPDSAKIGEFGLIITADQKAEVYGNLYVRTADGWAFVVDMSVPGAAIKGDKGEKGVSVSGATINGDSLVIQTTDPSTGSTAEYDAGSLADVASPIVTAQLDSRILVMDQSEYDALTEYAAGVVYLVRQ